MRFAVLRNLVLFALAVCASLPGYGQVDFNWRTFGPSNLGGSIRALKYTPDGNRVYAGSPSGGLWQSANNGNSWQRVTGFNTVSGTNFEPNLSVSAIDIDPSNNHILVGTGSIFQHTDPLFTGETPFSNINLSTRGYLGYTGQFGSGVFISTDNGGNFLQMAATAPASPFSIADPFTSILSVKGVNGRVFVGTHRGLFISDDLGGSVFQPTEDYTVAVTAANRLAQAPIYDIEVGANGAIYVATNAHIFISRDGGDTFDELIRLADLPVDTTDPFFSSTQLTQLWRIAVSTTDPNVMYISAARDRLLGVWKTENAGVSWETVAPRSSAFDGQVGAFSPCAEFDALAGGIVGHCQYSLILEIDPADNDRIFLGSYEWYEFDPTNGWVQNTSNLYFGFEDNDYVPSRITAFASNPSDPTIFLLGTDREVVRGIEGGRKFQIASGNLNAAQVFDVDVASDGRVLASTLSMGNIRSQGVTAGTTGSWFALNRFSPRRGPVAVSRYNSDHMVSSTRNTFQRSLDGGLIFNADWMGVPLNDTPFLLDSTVQVPDPMNPGGTVDSTVFYAEDSPDGILTADQVVPMGPVVMSEIDTTELNIALDSLGRPVNEQFVFVGSRRGTPAGHVWLVRNPFNPIDEEDIPTFTAIFQLEDAQDHISALAVTKDTTRTLFVGTTDGRIFRIRNAHRPNSGELPFEVTQILDPAVANTPARWITSLTLHPTNQDTLLVTYGTYRTADPLSGGCASCGFVWATNAALSSNTPTFYNQHDHFSGYGFYPAYTAMFNPRPETPADRWMLLGTEKGMFVTFEDELNFTNVAQANGVNWFEANDGAMSRVPVYKLAYNGYRLVETPYPDSEEATYMRLVEDNTNSFIYAATWGSGVMRSNLLSPGASRHEAKNRLTDPFGFDAYPNPSTGTMKVRFELKQASTADISVISIKGDVVKRVPLGMKPAGVTETPLQLNDLPAGMYILRANFGAQRSSVSTKRVIIQ